MICSRDRLSRLTWFTGFITTLLIPLLILLVTHGILRIPLLESQGTVNFLFFIWITSWQAILTLTRLRQVFPQVRLQQTYGLSELGILRSKSRESGSLWVKIGGEA